MVRVAFATRTIWLTPVTGKKMKKVRGSLTHIKGTHTVDFSLIKTAGKATLATEMAHPVPGEELKEKVTGEVLIFKSL